METNLKSQLGEFVFSTPAKFILSGEHSVVYGKDAIVATADMRTYGRCIVHPNFGNNSTFADIELRDTKNTINIVTNFNDIKKRPIVNLKVC